MTLIIAAFRTWEDAVASIRLLRDAGVGGERINLGEPRDTASALTCAAWVHAEVIDDDPWRATDLMELLRRSGADEVWTTEGGPVVDRGGEVPLDAGPRGLEVRDGVEAAEDLAPTDVMDSTDFTDSTDSTDFTEVPAATPLIEPVPDAGIQVDDAAEERYDEASSPDSALLDVAFEGFGRTLGAEERPRTREEQRRPGDLHARSDLGLTLSEPPAEVPSQAPAGVPSDVRERRVEPRAPASAAPAGPASSSQPMPRVVHRGAGSRPHGRGASEG